MKISYPDLTGETATQTSATIVTLADTTALDDCRKFSTAVTDADLADGDTVFVNIKKDASNLLVWEATYDSTAKTLTKVTELTAVGSIASTSAVNVEIVNPGRNYYGQDRRSRAFIEGYNLEYVSPTAIRATSGKVVINGVYYTDASNITTITGDALIADTLFHVFLYDDAGTRKLELDTVAPVYDNSLKYYKHASLGAAYRHIGSVWTHHTNANYFNFTATANGNERSYMATDEINTSLSSLQVVGSVTTDSSASWHSFDISALVPPNMKQVSLKPWPWNADPVGIGVSTTDQGSDTYSAAPWVARAKGGASVYFFPGNCILDTTATTLYYRTVNSGTDVGSITVEGWRIVI